jgi:hypothetical protein
MDTDTNISSISFLLDYISTLHYRIDTLELQIQTLNSPFNYLGTPGNTTYFVHQYYSTLIG